MISAFQPLRSGKSSTSITRFMPITLKNENLQRREFFFPKEKHFFASKDVTSTVISHSFEENPKDAAGWQKKALKWKIVGKSETD